MCLARKKGTYQGKAESPTLGQPKLPCNSVTSLLAPTTRCVTNPLAPTICCFFWPIKYPRELGLGAFSSSHPWWGWEALARVSNKFPYCKLHCLRSLLSRPGTRTTGRTSGSTMVKNSPASSGDIRDTGLIPELEIPLRRKWKPTPVYLLGKFYGQRCLAGYSPWAHKELDTTEHTHIYRN